MKKPMKRIAELKVNKTLVNKLRSKILDLFVSKKMTITAIAKECGLQRKTIYEFLYGKPIQFTTLKKLEKFIEDLDL